MKHDFNHKAETFDSPKNIFLANLVCQAVEAQIDLLSDKAILDFGGGTGLLALPLAKQAKSVTFESRATRHQEYPVFGAGFTGKSLGTAI